MGVNLGPGAVVVKKHDQFYLRCLASLERTEYQTLLKGQNTKHFCT